jgi:hypothetical protein
VARGGSERGGTILAGSPGMRPVGIFVLGYLLFLGGVLLALWKTGVLASLGSTWTIIGLIILVGVGTMAAAVAGRNRTIIS